MTMGHDHADLGSGKSKQGRRPIDGYPAHEDCAEMTVQAERQLRELLVSGDRIPSELAAQFSGLRLEQLVRDAISYLADSGNQKLAEEIERLFDHGDLVSTDCTMQNCEYD